MKTLKTKIIKQGNSTAIRLTRDVLEAAGLELGDSVVIEVNENGTLNIRKESDSFKDELRSFYQNGGMYEEVLIDFGVSVGEEW